jgi:hypothetical protein
MRVTYESLLAAEEWGYHWEMAARQIQDTIEEGKGHKTYALPSIVVLDVSRLARPARHPAGRGPASSSTCWTPASWAILAARSSCARL